MTAVRIPLYALIAALLLAVVVGAVCAWRGRRYERTLEQAVPLREWEEVPHPPP